MVKFSNKAKSKPSKRRSLKTKFKIERKVKQHRKKMKKQAKKIVNKGNKRKNKKQTNFLPNLFPYKYQMLQQFKNNLPNTQESTAVKKLDALEYGLIIKQNKCIYFPKNKDILTKKTITNETAIVNKAKLVLYVLDARNPQICRNYQFEQNCVNHGLTRIMVISKADTVSSQKLAQQIKKLQEKGQTVISFSAVSSKKNSSIQKLISVVKNIYPNQCIFIAGKSNVGKHTLIMRIAKYAKVYQLSGCDLFELQIAYGLRMLDAPYSMEDNSSYPLFKMPSQLLQGSLTSQEEQLIRILCFSDKQSKKPIFQHNQFLIHYEIQAYISIDDVLKKVGKILRIFGKGGMIDLNQVRRRIISDWFTGNLNECLLGQN